MKARAFALVMAVALWASVGWAGEPIPTPAPVRPGAPLMDDGGLVLLAVALVGTGLTFLRGRKR